MRRKIFLIFSLSVLLAAVPFTSGAAGGENPAKEGPPAPLPNQPREGAAENKARAGRPAPPDEVIENLELLQNLPMLKELDLYRRTGRLQKAMKDCRGDSEAEEKCSEK